MGGLGSDSGIMGTRPAPAPGVPGKGATEDPEVGAAGAGSSRQGAGFYFWSEFETKGYFSLLVLFSDSDVGWGVWREGWGMMRGHGKAACL